MKATGIVRRIDDLGRVIIPKDIRRSLKIREGDPLEIFIENNCVCFQKYSTLGSLAEEPLQIAIKMASNSGLRPIAIYDTDKKLRAWKTFRSMSRRHGKMKTNHLSTMLLTAFTRLMQMVTAWDMWFAIHKTWAVRWT